MTTSPLSVVGLGVCSPLGANARESSLAYRAGSACLSESAALTPDGAAPTIALCPVLPPYLTLEKRLEALLSHAVQDALTRWQLDSPQMPLRGRSGKVFLLLDEEPSAEKQQGAHVAEALGLTVRQWFREQLGTNCQLEIDMTGPAGIADVLRRASEELSRGQYDFAFLCASHTDHDPERLAFLEKHRRIHSAEQLDGLLLGELAGLVILSTPAQARALGLQSLTTVHPVQLAHEKARFDNDEPSFTAAGLTVAARKALAALPRESEHIGWVSSDASFEMFRVHELQAVLTRIQSHLTAPQVLELPCQRMGHLGATTGLWQIFYAAEAWYRGFAPAAKKLCFLGSDTGARAAFLLERPPQ